MNLGTDVTDEWRRLRLRRIQVIEKVFVHERSTRQQDIGRVSYPKKTALPEAFPLVRRQPQQPTAIGSQVVTLPPPSTLGSANIAVDSKSPSVNYPTAKYTPTSSSSSAAHSPGAISQGVQQGLIAGGCVGALVVVLLFVTLFIRARRRRRRRSRQSLSSTPHRLEKDHIPFKSRSASHSQPWSVQHTRTSSKDTKLLDAYVVHSPSHHGRLTPPAHVPSGFPSPGPGVGSTYTNSPSFPSPAVMSPGLLTPPSRAAHFGRPMASPINLSPQSTSHLIPAPLHPLPRSPTASLHPPLPAFHFPAAPTPDNILPIPPPRRPVDAYAPYPENSGLSVIGEEIEDFLSSNSSGARGPSHPTSRQSPKHSRTPSTFSAHHRPLRDRDRDRERSRASLVLSSAGSVDSNPRFMSIHSWVNHQSNRIGAGPSGSGSNSGSGSASHSASRSRSHSHSGSGSPFERRSDITPGESGDMAVSPGYDEYQGMRRMDSTSTATVFRQHPGDRIEMSRGSVIPSDVLDSVQYNEGNVL